MSIEWKLTFGITVLLLLSMYCTAQPQVQNINGNVYNTDGTPIPGVMVSAWLNGTERTSTQAQSYGLGYESFYNLDVMGNPTEQGLEITFMIQGVEAEQTVVFTHYTRPVNLNLTPVSYIDPASIPAVTTSTTTLVVTTTFPLTSTTTLPLTTSTTTQPTASTTTSTVALTTVSQTTTHPSTSTILGVGTTTVDSTTTFKASTSTTSNPKTNSLGQTNGSQPAQTTTLSTLGKPQEQQSKIFKYLPYGVAVALIGFILLVVLIILVFIVVHAG